MSASNIQTLKKVVPMIYAYTTPGITYHDGYIKIGQTEQDVDTRIKQQVHTAGVKAKKEAVNFYNYCHATLIRYLFLMTDESLTSLGKRVIDIMDYSDGSIVDFTEPLDSQLYEMVGLSKKEQEYIQSIIDEIDRKRGKETTHD